MQFLSWRDKAMVVIDQVRFEHPDVSGDELRELLKDHYPFGERKYHPYKMWCSAVREVCGPMPHQRRAVPLPLFD